MNACVIAVALFLAQDGKLNVETIDVERRLIARMEATNSGATVLYLSKGVRLVSPQPIEKIKKLACTLPTGD